jgi:hypothetical protein
MYISSSVDGTFLPTYVVFQGESEACIPGSILQRSDVWCGWSPSGFMDEANYLNYRHHFITWRDEHLGKNANVVDIVDNHFSHLGLSQLLTAAVANVNTLTGPSGCTNAW